MMSHNSPEVLALRLLYAYLIEDVDEGAFLVWRIQDESGCSPYHFRIAACTALEASIVWRKAGQAEVGRRLILEKLERLTVAA